MIQPQERVIQANGLAHHVLHWGAEIEPKKPLVLCAHGFLDLAWSYQFLADELVPQGYQVVAWDWRGHGETERVGRGGYYHFYDYVLDLDELLPQLVALGPEGAPRPQMIAHSMGGTIAALFAGTRKDALASLTLIEGLGPPSWSEERRTEKLAQWLDSVQKIRQGGPRPMSLEDAAQRLQKAYGALPGERARWLAEKATRPLHDDPEQRVWRYDPMHRSTSPTPFQASAFDPFLAQIEVPVLLIQGEKGMRLPDEDQRVAQLRDATLIELPGLGHMIPQLAPELLAQEFLRWINESAYLKAPHA